MDSGKLGCFEERFDENPDLIYCLLSDECEGKGYVNVRVKKIENDIGQAIFFGKLLWGRHSVLN